MADTKKVTIKRMDALKSILAEQDDDSELFKPVRALASDERSIVEEPVDIGQSDNKSGRGMGWYVVHTYSGYENIVHDNIVKSVENRNLQDKILNVEVPTQEVTEITGKKSKKTQRKIFPGYVLIEMDADDNEAWYVVRNTRGVTGFVGPGSKPVPLTYEEVMATLSGTKKATKAEFEVGDTVVVVSGVWVNNSGVVSKIDETKATATIMVEMFDRETPVEISFSDVKKIQ